MSRVGRSPAQGICGCACLRKNYSLAYYFVQATVSSVYKDRRKTPEEHLGKQKILRLKSKSEKPWRFLESQVFDKAGEMQSYNRRISALLYSILHAGLDLRLTA